MSKLKHICGLLVACHCFFMAFLLSGCAQQKGFRASESGDTLQLKHARLLTIVEHEGYTQVTIADPWHKGKTLHSYVLVPKRATVPTDLPEGTLVRTPLERSVVATSAHCWLAQELDAVGCVAGVCDARFVHAGQIKARLASNGIADCGNGQQPDVEKIASIGADGIIMSPFEGSTGYGRLAEAGLPIIEAADYMEPTALGRAEWMVFYGMLWNRRHQAVAVFNKVETAYQQLCTQAKALPKGPTVLLDRPYQGTWYVPGGQSTVARMMVDAGLRYVFADDEHSGGVAKSREEMVLKAADADVWLLKYSGVNPLTKAQLLAEEAAYSQIKAFREGMIYECGTDVTDYFDESAFRPDLLLSDFLQIAHPASGQGALRYYQPLGR